MMYNIAAIKLLHLELSSRCNASCPSCSRNLSGGPKASDFEETDLTLENIKNFLDIDIIRNIRRINYCGNLGDPGMNKDLLKIVNYFKENASPMLIQIARTNGGMRNEFFWAELGEFFSKTLTIDAYAFGHSGICFSVDGLEDTNHIYRRGVTWSKLWNNMQAYSKAGGKGYWEFLVFEHNQHQIEEAKKRAEDLGLEFVLKKPLGFREWEGKIEPISVFTKDRKFDYYIYPEKYHGTRLIQEKTITLNFPTKNSEPYLSEYSKQLVKESTIKCKSVRWPKDQEIFISADGHLFPCCYLGGVIGNATSMYDRYQFKKNLDKIGGLDFLSLKTRTAKEILTDPVFVEFFNISWHAPDIESGKLLWCSEVCGEKSEIDKIYSKSGLNFLRKA